MKTFKKITAAVLCLVLALSLFGACAEEKVELSPEQILNTTVFDEYHDIEELKGDMFDMAIEKIRIETYIEVIGEYYFDIEYAVNEEIPYFDEAKPYLDYDPQVEDVVCVIEYVLGAEEPLMLYYFKTNGKTKQATPLAHILFSELIDDNDRKIMFESDIQNPNNIIGTLYGNYNSEEAKLMEEFCETTYGDQ